MDIYADDFPLAMVDEDTGYECKISVLHAGNPDGDGACVNWYHVSLIDAPEVTREQAEYATDSLFPSEGSGCASDCSGIRLFSAGELFGHSGSEFVVRQHSTLDL